MWYPMGRASRTTMLASSTSRCARGLGVQGRGQWVEGIPDG